MLGTLTLLSDANNQSTSFRDDSTYRLWKSIDGSGNEITREYTAVSSGGSPSSCTSCYGVF
ncbi:MAG: hypothetical protein GY801_28800 [bacterium]|nr:hypothetical protein [bacterium]